MRGNAIRSCVSDLRTLTTRMGRDSRGLPTNRSYACCKTNAFSKKWENHEAALALFFAYYNWCRVHMTLKTTPAKEAGLTDHVWSVQELLAKTGAAGAAGI